MSLRRRTRARLRRRVAPRARGRRGSVLIVVLVVIVLLTYGVYGFTERMLAEAEAADAYGKSVEATAFAESGVEMAAAYVAARAADPENPLSLYHQPTLFGGIILRPSASARAIGRVSLVAPVEADAASRQVRFGLADESGKLNLNAIQSFELDEVEERTLLMSLPLMTEDIADAILDYVDEDGDLREFGAESEYYESLSPPYPPKNGPLESIDELLLVRGVTPELLYGEDANRNGLLDPAENDGPSTPPIDDGDGVLRLGWQAILTVYSRESNSRPDGTKKIFINQGLLTDLYDAVAAEESLGEDAAKFIVAYRMYGPNDADTTSTGGSSSSGSTTGSGSGGTSSSGSGAKTGTSGAGSGTNGAGSGSNGAKTGTSGASSGTTGAGSGSNGAGSGQSASQQMNQLAANLSQALTGAQQGGQVTRGGLDLSAGAQFEITSLYDLIDREVDVPAASNSGAGQGAGTASNANGSGKAQTIVSPWTTGGIATEFPLLVDTFALTENSFVEGRVNVNEARPEVLLGIPGMPQQIVDGIMAARNGGNGAAVTEDPERRTTAWLVARSVSDLPTMRQLDKYLTARGDIFRVQAVGFFDGGGPAARVEAVIDGTVVPPKILEFHDLTELGRGYAPVQLLPGGGPTAP